MEPGQVFSLRAVLAHRTSLHKFLNESSSGTARLHGKLTFDSAGQEPNSQSGGCPVPAANHSESEGVCRVFGKTASGAKKSWGGNTMRFQLREKYDVQPETGPTEPV